MEDVLRSLLGSKSLKAVYNFRIFATPSLIKSTWVIGSWLLILGWIGSAVYYPLDAVTRGTRVYAANTAAIQTQKSDYCKTLRSKVSPIMDAVGQSFLKDGNLDEKALMQFRSNSEIIDIIFANKTTKKLSFLTTGADPKDVIENISNDVQLVMIEKDRAAKIRFESPVGTVAIILRDDTRFSSPKDPTYGYCGFAIVEVCIEFMLLIYALVCLRLFSEFLVLAFRFVDEIVSIGETLKDSQK